MPPATVPPPQSTAAPPPTTETLHQISLLLADLLPSTLSVTSFAARWQVLRSKLAAVQTLTAEINDSPHWSDNPLLPTLLPALLSTLRRTEILCHHCRGEAAGRGKLLMQSDLDMATGWLSKQINDLELLLRSGVLHHSTAIVLSRPNSASSKEELTFFVRDLFARLQIGGLEFKLKALDSLIQLLIEDSKSAMIVAREGDMRCLTSLLDSSGDDSVRELAVHAVSLLVAAGDLPRKCVFEEGALGPLLRIIECSSVQVKERAAMAVEFITADHDNAWAISAYGGVPVLIELCKSGSLIAQSYAVGAIRNVSVVEDIRTALAEEGAVPVLIDLLVSGNASAQGKTANCISILASTSVKIRNSLLQEKGLQKLVQLFHECPVAETVEHVLRAIYSFSDDEMSNRILSESTMFIVQLADLIKLGKNIRLQHIAASLLAKLSISDRNKIVIAGCMGSLVRLMEAVKPDGVQEVAAKALTSLLSVKSNRKELVRDEKSLMRLAQMLDSRFEVVSKKSPVSVVAAIMAGGSHGCRKRLVAAGVHGHLQRLVEMDVVGAKKALQRLSGNRLTSLFSRTWRD
ncbi:protein CELLULOSE SYNTHASE INTERACTIVE 1-like [Salvia splendens]|uniref:protein CELLULOSE SYNTHASE INTERACTIVE 1-like n=1 Tax=Salvia splendens TaxID=180675 RepID=UPI001101BBE1|nr:protein CELLULOSE SYNTHASE INTERACTIVE 1-like [Salvia splendens]